MLYVDNHAPGSNTGMNWRDAYWCLQDALAAAKGSDEIWLAGGTYKPDQHAIAWEWRIPPGR